MECKSNSLSKMIEELKNIKSNLNFSDLSPSGRRYPRRFKMLSARALEEGIGVSELSRKLSVQSASLYAWREQYKKEIKPIEIISQKEEITQSDSKIEIRIGANITMNVPFCHMDVRFLKALNEACQ